MKRTGIDELRAAVNYFNYQREDWLAPAGYPAFTAAQLMRIWRFAMAHEDLPEFADEWDDKTLRKALKYAGN